MDHRDKSLVALTHVCRAWRETFTSRSSLWTDLNCKNADKTRVYLERSKSSPINLWLDRSSTLSRRDPFLQVVPHSIGRLRSLSVKGRLENLRDITTQLSRHAPLLERLDIGIISEFWMWGNPALPATLFDGDLSPLRMLRLQSVRTELPWRNMTNLTSFTLCNMSPSDPSIKDLLDFFKGAPRLRNIELNCATPARPGGQNRRLVSLACLKRMDILWGEPSSLFLDHLLIPVGAKFTKWLGSFADITEDLPGSVDNLRSISDFTEVRLRIGEHDTRMKLSGPNGQFCIASRIDTPYSALESLVHFDTSMAFRLEVISSDRPFRFPPYQKLRFLKNLRTLTLSRCINPYIFTDALHPGLSSPEVVACPKLEELVFVLRTDRITFDAKEVAEMAAARASRGAKLKTVRIVGGQDKLNMGDLLELGKHVSRVGYDPGVDVVNSDGDDSDEEH